LAKGRRFSRSDAAAKWGEFTAPGGSVLGEEAGGGDGAVDGAAGTDIVEDGLVSRGEFDLVHEDLIPVNTITSERAEPRRREGWSSCRPMKWKGLVGQKIVRSPVTGFWRGRKRHRGRGEPAFRAAGGWCKFGQDWRSWKPWAWAETGECAAGPGPCPGVPGGQLARAGPRASGETDLRVGRSGPLDVTAKFPSWAFRVRVGPRGQSSDLARLRVRAC